MGRFLNPIYWGITIIACSICRALTVYFQGEYGSLANESAGTYAILAFFSNLFLFTFICAPLLFVSKNDKISNKLLLIFALLPSLLWIFVSNLLLNLQSVNGFRFIDFYDLIPLFILLSIGFISFRLEKRTIN